MSNHAQLIVSLLEGTWGECKDSKGNVLQCVDTDGDNDSGKQTKNNNITKDSAHGGKTCPPALKKRTVTHH